MHSHSRFRRANDAAATISSMGSIGFDRCTSKPLRMARMRSSDRANAVNAAAGISRMAVLADSRTRVMNANPSIVGIPKSAISTLTRLR